MKREWRSVPLLLKPGDIRVPGLRQMVPATRRVESYYNPAAEKKSSFGLVLPVRAPWQTMAFPERVGGDAVAQRPAIVCHETRGVCRVRRG